MIRSESIKPLLSAALLASGASLLASCAGSEHALHQSDLACDKISEVQRPNVIIILADDMGYGDVQALNEASQIPTPNLDRMVAEGMTFTDGHSPSAVCTPSRYGLLTGRYCWRTRLRSHVLMGYSSHLIDPERLTMADMMKDAGYTTAWIGKWHLGMDLPLEGEGDARRVLWDQPIENGPASYGFDEAFGIVASLDMPPYGWVEGDRFVSPCEDRFAATSFPDYRRGGEISVDFDHRAALDMITERACDWIAAQAEEGAPFFLYLPLTSPHKPVLPAERFVGSTELGLYGDFIVQTDDVVGRVLDTLEAAGVSDNTLVVYSSDNASFMFNSEDPGCPDRYRSEDGADHVSDDRIQAYLPEHHQANFIYRGTKADIYEGGHRVPFLVRWPMRVAAGSVQETPVCLTDLMATLCELTGQTLPVDAGEDSTSLMGLMTGDAEDLNQRPLVLHSANGTFALREGRWKLLFSSGSGGRARPTGRPFDGEVQLYDLQDDPQETINLAEQFPERVEVMRATLERIRTLGRSN